LPGTRPPPSAAKDGGDPTPRSFRHWTPRYILDRLGVLIYERTHPENPWLTRQAVDFLEQWLRPTDHGFEWGSGRSTVWFARRVAGLISIEHDPAWYDRVRARMAALSLHNVDYRLVPMRPASPDPRTHPYVTTARSVSPDSLDFALVDGEFRDHCARVALRLIKPGGILVIDNVNWFLPHATRSPSSVGASGPPASPDWGSVAAALAEWRCYWTSSGVTDTAVFFKPGR
jgi:hypothetical protein